jgi:multidrug efflux pump subunit AcrA (membrane-fusion protein)
MAQAGVKGAQADLQSARADAGYWGQELKRAKELLDAGAVSAQEYQREEADAAGARARVQGAEAAVGEKTQALASARARSRQAVADADGRRARLAASQAGLRKAQAAVTRAKADAGAAVARVARSRAEAHAARAMTAERAAGVRAAVSRTGEAAAAVAEKGAALTVARTVRGYTEIRASRGGYVVQRLVSPGVLVAPGTRLMRVAETRQVRLQAYVTARDLPGIAVGSRVEVGSPRLPGVLSARVTAIFPAADPTARTSVVEALVDNRDGRLVPGDAVSLKLLGRYRPAALTVPTAAIVFRTVAGAGPSSRQEATIWLAVADGAAEKPDYTCPMHPKVHQDRPGKCPICGMDLVLSRPVAAAEKPDYTCPMHPQVHSDKPGKCLLCGMDLVKAKASGAGVRKARQVAVTVGAADADRTEVVAGLKAGDEVIWRGHQDLHDGDIVYPVTWGAEGPTELPPGPGMTGPGAASAH